MDDLWRGTTGLTIHVGNQMENRVLSLSADGAYDTKCVYDAIFAQQAQHG